MAVCACTERERFWKDTGGEHRDFEQIVAVLEFPWGGDPARIVIVEQIETAQWGERHTIIEDRIRLASEDLDLGAKVDEGLGEVAGVDTLPTYMRLSAVGQVGDAQRGVIGGGRRHPVKVTVR